ncbi:MAG: response regulator [Rhodospirillales bacterium]|nr:response regulator [Rhodospirillales bacterium]
MADTLVFARVEAIVCEANGPLRRNIRDLLRQLGFGEVSLHGHPAECLPQLERGPVDLLICDHQADTDAGTELVHGIRHQAIDNNPFVVSVTTMHHQPGNEGKRALGRAVNSGTDMLLVKPFTSATFADRIYSIASKRKPFVATADYIGPTRRQKPRNRRERMMEFPVPNPVKEIAGGMSREVVSARIRKSSTFLNQRKLHFDITEIEIRADEVRDAMVRGIDGETIRNALDRLRAATSDIQRRNAKDAAPHVSELCKWMFGVADRIESGPSDLDARILAVIPRIVAGFRVALNSKGGGNPDGGKQRNDPDSGGGPKRA